MGVGGRGWPPTLHRVPEEREVSIVPIPSRPTLSCIQYRQLHLPEVMMQTYRGPATISFTCANNFRPWNQSHSFPPTSQEGR